jgi:hypothetical protein
MQLTRPVPLVFATLGAAMTLLALLTLPGMHHPTAANAPDDTGSPQSITVTNQVALASPALDPTAHPILSNLQVRRAIAHCTNKDALIASVYPALTPAQRADLVMDSPILPASWAYSPPATVYPYNPATGRALLDAAGWTLAPGATYRTRDGRELYLTITATDAAFRQTFLAVFETQMRSCGVHVMRYHRNATWVYGAGGLYGRNFEMGEYGVLGVEAPDLLDQYGCSSIPSHTNQWSGNNLVGWCNQAADAAATQANNTALTQAQRKAFFATFTNLFAAELPSLILFRRDGADVWEHIDFNLETYAQERPVGPAGTGATPLLYRHHDDLPTRVAVPAGALAAPIAMRFTPLVENANPPPGGQIAVSSFRLDAVQGGVPAASYNLAGPAVVTVSYPDPALTGLVEDSLALHVWDNAAQIWQPAVETCPPGQQYADVNTAQRTVTTNVCHFSEFALVAEQHLYVDGASGQDVDTCGALATPCRTIWHTLTSRARWGATLYIAAGAYPENLDIDNLAVTLRGGYAPTPAGWTPRTGETVIDGGGVERALLVHGGSDVLLEDLTLTGGRAPEHACWGAGLSVTNGHATLRRVIVRDNVARCTSGQSGGGAGGGLDANNDEGPASLRVEDSLILRNQAGDHGSALNTWQTTVAITNVVVAGNSRHVLAINATTFRAVNVTVAGNDPSGQALLDFNQPSTITLLNSIVWNSGGIACGAGGGACDFTYSDLQGGRPGVGNIDVNPQFVDAANGDYRLRWGSPAIDAGANSGAPPFDLEGVARPQDGSFDGIRVADMGAYERAPRTMYLPAITRRMPALRYR